MIHAVGKINDPAEIRNRPKTHESFFGYQEKSSDHQIRVQTNSHRNIDVEVVDGYRVQGSVIGSSDSSKFLHEKSEEHNELMETQAKHAIPPQNIQKRFNQYNEN